MAFIKLKSIVHNYNLDKERRLFLQSFVSKQNRESKVFVIDKKNLVYRKCPLCNASTSAKLFSAPIYTFLKCDKCGLVYANPILRQSLLNKLYTKVSVENSWLNREYSEYSEYTKKNENYKRYRGAIKKILKYAPYNNSLLDIGCSFGVLLREAKPYFTRVEGIELNKKTSKIARGFGIKVYNKPLEDLRLSRKYDVVVLIHVLEHMVNFNSLLKEIHKILHKKGILYISTPNSDSLSLSCFKGRHIYVYDRFHLSLFNKKTLLKLAKKTKFNVLEIQADNTLDITINEMFFYFFNNKRFIHRANYNPIVSPISFMLSLLITKFLNLTNILKNAGKGEFLEAILQKV